MAWVCSQISVCERLRRRDAALRWLALCSTLQVRLLLAAVLHGVLPERCHAGCGDVPVDPQLFRCDLWWHAARFASALCIGNFYALGGRGFVFDAVPHSSPLLLPPFG